MSFDTHGRPQPPAKRPRGDSPFRPPAGQGAASSSAGPWVPLVGDPMSVHLPIAENTQADVAAFNQAAGEAHLPLTVVSGALPSIQDGYIAPLSPTVVGSSRQSTQRDTLPDTVGLPTTFGDTLPDTVPVSTFPDTLPDTIPDTVPQFAMDADDIEDDVPPNQEAYVPTTLNLDDIPVYRRPGDLWRPAPRRNPPPSAPSRSTAKRRRNKKKSLSHKSQRGLGSQRTPGPSANLPASAHRRRDRRPMDWEPEISTTETIRTPRSSSHGISGSVSSTSYVPPMYNDENVSPTLSASSSVSVIDYPNPYRAPLAVLEEMGARSRSRPPARPLGPLVPRNEYRQGRLPFRRVNRRVVDERFVEEPAYRPYQRIPARPMRQWSRLPQYRQIPIELALNVRHTVVQVSAADFVHMGFPDAGVAHDVLYQGPGQRDLTRYTRYSEFRRDFERPVIDVPSSGSSQRRQATGT